MTRELALALVAVLVAVLALAGCNSSTHCARHGGVRYWSGSWYYCRDGTVEPF